ncbi:hypothetical protein HAX54_014972, partial [Datura stramonium]|nr:hypothetical protein [Datura stramonium]
LDGKRLRDIAKNGKLRGHIDKDLEAFLRLLSSCSRWSFFAVVRGSHWWKRSRVFGLRIRD